MIKTKKHSKWCGWRYLSVETELTKNEPCPIVLRAGAVGAGATLRLSSSQARVLSDLLAKAATYYERSIRWFNPGDIVMWDYDVVGNQVKHRNKGKIVACIPARWSLWDIDEMQIDDWYKLRKDLWHIQHRVAFDRVVVKHTHRDGKKLETPKHVCLRVSAIVFAVEGEKK